jgi:hypothetical protein
MEHASSSKVPNAVLGALSVLCAFEKSEDMKSFSSSHNSSSGATEKGTGPLRESPSPCVDLSFAYVSGKPWRDCAVVSFCTCVCATSVEVLDVDDRLGEGADFGLSGLRLPSRRMVARMNAARLRAVSLSGVQNLCLPSDRSWRTSCCERRSLQPVSRFKIPVLEVDVLGCKCAIASNLKNAHNHSTSSLPPPLYQTLQNAALRQILGAFQGSPIKAMEIEASILPTALRAERLCQQYALRMLSFAKSHPIHTALLQTKATRPTNTATGAS